VRPLFAGALAFAVRPTWPAGAVTAETAQPCRRLGHLELNLARHHKMLRHNGQGRLTPQRRCLF
jgi:hypothetical protein